MSQEKHRSAPFGFLHPHAAAADSSKEQHQQQQRKLNMVRGSTNSSSTKQIDTAVASGSNGQGESDLHSNVTDQTVITQSITKSDVSLYYQDADNLASIVEEAQICIEDAVMDDASTHSFDIPDPDQWEIKGLGVNSDDEDANSQCSVVAQDGEEDDWEPLNLCCFLDDRGKTKKKEQHRQQQEQEQSRLPVTKELVENVCHNAPVAGLDQVDGPSTNTATSQEMKIEVVKTTSMDPSLHVPDCNIEVGATFPFASFPGKYHHSDAAAAPWSSAPMMQQHHNNNTGDSSSSMGFYPGMGYYSYRQSDIMQRQYSDGRSTYSSCASYPHQGYNTNDATAGVCGRGFHNVNMTPPPPSSDHCHDWAHPSKHRQHSLPNESSLKPQALHQDGSMPPSEMFQNGYGWMEKPPHSAVEQQSTSESKEMLQARLGLSSFYPVDRFGPSNNYEHFSRADSYYAYTYSADNAEMKNRHAPASVVSAPADISWHRNAGNAQMGHCGYGNGGYPASMHDYGGSGIDRQPSAMSAHSMDYPRANNASYHHPNPSDPKLPMGTPYPNANNNNNNTNHSVHNGHNRMYPSHLSEATNSMYSVAPGPYPPSVPSSSSYYQDHHPSTVTSIGHCDMNHGLNMVIDQPVQGPVTLLHNGAIIGEMDRILATKFSYAVLSEVESCAFLNRDRTGKRRELELGFRGLACRHCKGFAKKIGGRLFPSTIKTMSDTQKTLIPLYNHLVKCPAVPNETKESLRSFKDLHDSERKRKSYGSQKALFTEVWRRLHGIDCEGGESNDATPV